MLKYLKRKKTSNTQDINEAASDVDAQIIDIIKNSLAKDITVVFDIGAYHGRYAKTINDNLHNAVIHCFEPFPNSFEILKKELKMNCYHLYPFAMSDKEGIQTFYVNELNETNSLIPSVVTNSQIDNLIMNKAAIAVNVTTIETFCERENINHIDLLKIDAQGNTLNILKGATALLFSKSIRVIQCEVEFIEIYENQYLFHNVTQFLEDFGYKLYSLYQMHYDINNRLSWADALYFIE